MDPRRFDALAKALAGGLPRRRLLRRLGGGLAALTALGAHRPTAAQEQGEERRTVQLACEPCFCTDDRCDCCLIGITGGGVVQTPGGEAQLVLFASRLEAGTTAAAGFVRWILPGEGSESLTLESVGPIAYEDVADDERAREVRGTMQANGSGEHPFVLRLHDAGPDAAGQDTAALSVGDQAADDFSYDGDGPLVGGDLQLLGSVAPVA
jgi:hypothetical protein